jgi:hypothetical protein
MVCHLVEPGADGLPIPDRAGLTRQGEEGGLKGILGRVLIVRHIPADAQHHRAVPPQEQLERRFVMPGHETTQQIRVRDVACRRPAQDTA